MEEFEKFYNKALRFLSFRPRSEKEVRQNLRGKHAPFAIIEKVIAKLKEKNFINDEEFIKWWIEQRTTFRPKGMRAIKIELRQKGIPDEMINDQLSLIKDRGSNEVELIKKLIEQRMPRYKDLPKQKIYERLARFLAGKGFDFETIKDVLYEKLK